MFVGSLPQNDGKSRQEWCVDPLGITAAGAVGAVLRPGGGTDGGEPFFNSLVAVLFFFFFKHLVNFFFKAYHQSLIPHSDDTSLLGLSHTHLFLTSFSQVFFS